MPASSDDRPALSRIAWTAALIAPVLGLSLAPEAPMLANPRECPGALDAVLVGLARAWPHTPAGTLLWWTHAILALGAGIALWWTTAGRGRARPIPTALVVIGFVLSPALGFTLEPTAAGALAASVLALAATPAGPYGDAPGSAARLALPFLLLAALVPPLAVPAALAALTLAWFEAGSKAAVAAASLAVVAAPAAVLALLPALPPSLDAATTGIGACLAPVGVPTAAGARDALAFVYASTGPVLLALAALGAFAAGPHATGPRVWALVVLLAGAVLAASAGSTPPAAVLAPVVAAIWALAIAGTLELARPAIARARRPLSAGVIAVAVPVLAWSHAAARPMDADLAPLGHASVTRDMVAGILAQLPDRSALVREDAVVDMMLRSLDGWWQETGKDIVIVPKSREAVAAALPSWHVLALPRAQRDLQHQGFELGPAAHGGAAVRPSTPCAPVIGEWAAAPALAGAAHLAVVADSVRARGPYVIYVGGDEPFVPAPNAWPERARRGFHAERFDIRDGNADAALRESLAGDGLSQENAFGTHTHVARLELWRTPDAPLALPVSLGTPAAVMWIRRAPGAADAPSVLCASRPFDLRMF
jgi:hypothetical protein